MTDEKLLEELREATRGLTMMSESDYPFEVFRWGGAEPSEDFLRGLTGEAADAPVETRNAADFFRVAASEAEWKNAEQLADARRFQTLLRVLEEHLEDVRVYRVGSVNIPVYVAGRAASGEWLGVSTRVVET
ncbi:MAG TPA: nuclease A inhibitor family protein [Pyrinomonadaceae bacterium]